MDAAKIKELRPLLNKLRQKVNSKSSRIAEVDSDETASSETEKPEAENKIKRFNNDEDKKDADTLQFTNDSSLSKIQELQELVKSNSEENEKLRSLNSELQSKIDKLQDELVKVHEEMAKSKEDQSNLENQSINNQIESDCENESQPEE